MRVRVSGGSARPLAVRCGDGGSRGGRREGGGRAAGGRWEGGNRAVGGWSGGRVGRWAGGVMGGRMAGGS